MDKILLILNGKKSGQPDIREAVTRLRNDGQDIQVRVTWEYGDAQRFVEEAHNGRFDLVIAGGGDGTVNEVAHNLALQDSSSLSMAILPLGTANDFAVGCNIPLDPFEALTLAVNGSAKPIDLVKINDRHFINIASAGFGAKVTAETPVELKNALGGGAYILMGILRLANFTPYKAKIKFDNETFDCSATVGAVCNGRQTGSGQVLAPNAYINDGLLDVIIASPFPLTAINQVIDEVENPSKDGEYIKAFQCTRIEGESEEIIPLNLDGEPYDSKVHHYEIEPGKIRLVVPDDCPCIKK